MVALASIVLALPIIATAPAHGASKSSLESDGWTVIARTSVSGTFDGCDYDLPVPLDAGYTFLCQEYNYHYAYRPDFLVMDLDGRKKYLIDGEEFTGTLYKGAPTVTHVTGAFEGCDYDRFITLDNGLLFKCRTYHYHYAYRPEVIIFGSMVSIAGTKYNGELYRQ
jgi:hypothetical protein